MTSLRDKLTDEILPIGWQDLAPHFARGGLLIASPELDVITVGEAIARDDTAQVEAWITAGTLRRATDDDATRWAESTPQFQFLILQPWVLAQELPVPQAVNDPVSR